VDIIVAIFKEAHLNVVFYSFISDFVIPSPQLSAQGIKGFRRPFRNLAVKQRL
jgi:hypothetical protein